MVSFLVTFHPLSVGCPLAAAAFPGHAGFIAVFAVLNVAFLHAEVARQRRERRRCLEAEVASMRQEARDFRLISSALSSEHHRTFQERFSAMLGRAERHSMRVSFILTDIE